VQRERVIDIAEVLRDASLGDLRTLAEPPVTYDDLHDATNRLFDLLQEREVDYVLVGGLAMLQYVEGRNTRDIDLILAPRDLERLPEVAVATRDKDFAHALFDGVPLDLLLTSNQLFERVRTSYAKKRSFRHRDILCANPEGLVILKLFALPSLYRQGDARRIGIYEDDVFALLERYELDVEPFFGELAPYLLPTDIAELRKIVRDIGARIARVRERPFDTGSAPDP